jgi:hypothetical protein
MRLIVKNPFDMGVNAHFNVGRFTPGFSSYRKELLWLRITKSNAQNATAAPGNSESTQHLENRNTDAEIFKAAVISSFLANLRESKNTHLSPAQNAAHL